MCRTRINFPAKACPNCGKSFNRRQDESAHRFRWRRFCSSYCALHREQGVSASRREEGVRHARTTAGR